MSRDDDKAIANDRISPDGKDEGSTKEDKSLLKDVLWGMFQEHQQNARHHETQRSTVSNFIILVAGGIGTLVSSGGFTRDDLPLTILLILLGLFGAVFSASHFIRYHRHKKRAYAYLAELDLLLFENRDTLAQIKEDVDKKVKGVHHILSRTLNVHSLWLVLPLIVTGLGIVLTILSWQKKPESAVKPLRVIVETSDGKAQSVEPAR